MPARLAHVLEVKGPGKYGDIEIYELDAIRGLYEDFFEDPSDLLVRYLPFGVNNRSQELWVLDVSQAIPLVAKIWHETVPDDWPEENWQEFATFRDSDFELVGI